MGINISLPVKKRFISTSTIFSTTFGAFTPGLYDFGNDPACLDVITLPLDTMSIYFLDRLSVGGNIPEESYLGAINVFPLLTYKYSKRKIPIFQYPFPLLKYYDGLEVSTFLDSSLVGESVSLSLSGSLSQTPALLGIPTVKLSVSLSVFQIDNTEYNNIFSTTINRVK